CGAPRACRSRSLRPPPPQSGGRDPAKAAAPVAYARPASRLGSPASFEQLVGGQGEELDEFAQDQLIQDLPRRLHVRHALQLADLLVAELLVQGPIDLSPVGELRSVLHPLPELRAGDLRRGGIL